LQDRTTSSHGDAIATVCLAKTAIRPYSGDIDVWPDDLAVSPSLQSAARALRDLSKIRLNQGFRLRIFA
jgi:hypothetical protein